MSWSQRNHVLVSEGFMSWSQRNHVLVSEGFMSWSQRDSCGAQQLIMNPGVESSLIRISRICSIQPSIFLPRQPLTEGSHVGALDVTPPPSVSTVTDCKLLSRLLFD
ncbi:unnamed protein product [Boreogadus saida]